MSKKPEAVQAAVPKQEAPNAKRAEEGVDLDQVRTEAAEKAKEKMKAQASEIIDLCALAGMAQMAGNFIAKGINPEAVRKELLKKRADSSGDEIQSHVMPGTGTQAQGSMETNPAVMAAKKLAGGYTNKKSGEA